jgi:hypothetical protein
MKRCHRCRFPHPQGPRRRSFSARARAQRRRDVARCDAHPLAPRARAAGLHGWALRGYIGALERLDGTEAAAE